MSVCVDLLEGPPVASPPEVGVPDIARAIGVSKMLLVSAIKDRNHDIPGRRVATRIDLLKVPLIVIPGVRSSWTHVGERQAFARSTVCCHRRDASSES